MKLMVPTLDFIFKRILGSDTDTSRRCLMSLQNAFLEEAEQPLVTTLTNDNPYQQKEAEAEFQGIVDIATTDQLQRKHITEMQTSLHRAFIERLTFYLCKSFSSTIERGDEYEDLRPSVLLCFLEGKLRKFAKHPKDYVWNVELAAKQDPEIPLTNSLQACIVELGKFRVPTTPVWTAVEQWCWFFKYAGEVDSEAWPTEITIPEIHMSKEELALISQNPVERGHYEAQLKRKRDRAAIDAYVEVDVRLLDEAEARLRETQQQLRSTKNQLHSQQEQLVSQGQQLQNKDQQLQTQGQQLQTVKDELQTQGQQLQTVRTKSIQTIQRMERKLQRAQTSPEQLNALSLPDLLKLADDLEREVLGE